MDCVVQRSQQRVGSQAAEFVVGCCLRTQHRFVELDNQRNRSFRQRTFIQRRRGACDRRWRQVEHEIGDRAKFALGKKCRGLTAEVVCPDQRGRRRFGTGSSVGQNGEVGQTRCPPGRYGDLVGPLNIVVSHRHVGRLQAVRPMNVVDDGRSARTVGVVGADPLVGRFNKAVTIGGGEDHRPSIRAEVPHNADRRRDRCCGRVMQHFDGSGEVLPAGGRDRDLARDIQAGQRLGGRDKRDSVIIQRG